MKCNPVKATFIAAAALASSMAFAAEPAQPVPNMQADGDMSMHHPMKPDAARGGMKGMKGMKGMDGMDGMKGKMGGGMMEMMRSCHETMNEKGMSGGAMVPHLPPGNEKLEFQMHAEMMQKMGEIALKYADRIKEN